MDGYHNAVMIETNIGAICFETRCGGTELGQIGIIDCILHY